MPEEKKDSLPLAQNEFKKIAIIYLLYYHNQSYIDDMVSALKRMTYPKDKIELVIVSNPHPVEGSFVRYLEETVVPLSGKEIPHVTILSQNENLGFAGGNNVGTEWAIQNNFDYVYYHNNDGFFASNALEPLVQAFENDEKIGIAQSLIMLYPETELINSAGNDFHYLGFGFCHGYREKIQNVKLPAIAEVNYASGAGMMVKVDLIKKFGMWNKDFFMYHEDLEWCLRLRIAGYKIKIVRDSIFYHKYQFGRSVDKFFFMERNRHAVMLMFFRWPTLLLLFPIGIILEFGLWLFSIKNGYVKKRVEVYKYWLKWSNWQLWLKKRKYIQSIRQVNDRYLLKHTVSGINFQEKEVESGLVKYVANPIMGLYYWLIVRIFIFW